LLLLALQHRKDDTRADQADHADHPGRLAPAPRPPGTRFTRLTRFARRHRGIDASRLLARRIRGGRGFGRDGRRSFRHNLHRFAGEEKTHGAHLDHVVG